MDATLNAMFSKFSVPNLIQNLNSCFRLDEKKRKVSCDPDTPYPISKCK